MHGNEDTQPNLGAAPGRELRRGLAPGTPIGRYEVRRTLGMGGMGQVCAVWDREMQREVALKVLHRRDPRAIAAFKREFRALSDLQHPNLIRLYELVCEESRWFFTMELVDGEEFYAHVRAGHDPSFGRLRQVLRQLADALCTLHDAGLLHRDVKPANVIIGKSGRAVLLDFGLVKDLERHDSDSSRFLVGTVAYVSPEQVGGRRPSPASDWYSFGVMLYLGLTGRLPFEGRAIEILNAKREQRAPVPSEVALHVPDDLDRLCVELLDPDPARRPSGPEVLRRLGASSTAPRRKRRSTAPFVGRPRHLELLGRAYRSVRDGRATCVYVHGASGVGKSALISRFADLVSQEHGALFLSGRCYERESVPYKGFDLVVDELGRHLRRLPEAEAKKLAPDGAAYLARLFPSLTWLARYAQAHAAPPELASPETRRRRAFAAMRELLGRVARRIPLVVAIDDLQWADPDTALLLCDLMRPPDPPRLLLLLSYRTGERATSVALARLQAAGSPLALDKECARDLPVEALSPEDAAELASSLLDLPRDRAQVQAEAITRESGGNPYFVSELARFVNERGERALARTDQESSSAPPTLEELILARAEAVPPPARRLLKIVAVAGRPLEPRIAIGAARLEPGEPAALDLLLDAQLLRTRITAAGSAVEPYHDRIREAVVAELEMEELREHHGHLALALEESERADPEFLAVHFHGARDYPRAARYTARAAEGSAKALAFDRAARLYKLALELTPADSDSRAELEVKYAQALANAGRSSAAAKAFLLARRHEGQTAPALAQQAANQLMRAGRAEESLDIYRDVLAPARVRIPASPRRALLPLALLRARLRLRGLEPRARDPEELDPAELAAVDALYSASSGLAFVDPMRGLYLHAHHLLRALDAGCRYRAARALAAEAAASSIDGSRGAHRTRKRIQQVEALARGTENPPELALAPPARTFADVTAGLARFHEGRFGEAREPIEDALRAFREESSGTAWESAVAHIHLSWALFFSGDLERYKREVDEGLRDAYERDDMYAATGLGFAGIFRGLLADDADDARRRVREAIEHWPSAAFQVQHLWALLTTTYVDLYAGDPGRAFSRLERSWPGFARSMMGRVQLLRVFLRAARAGAAVSLAREMRPGHPRRLLRLARRDARQLAREGTPFSRPAAAALRGAAAACAGKEKEAEGLLEQALAGFEAAGMPLHAATCRLELGRLRGAAGRALEERAEKDLRESGVADPDKMARALVPGF